MTLKKFLYIAIITILPLPVFSGTDYVMSKNKDCMAIDRPWPLSNDVYFCGHTDNKSCAGVKHGNKKHTIMHAHAQDFNGARYWCCNGNESKLGTFKQGSNWSQSETVTEQLPNGGTCTWTRTKTICDSEWKGTKCTKVTCPTKGAIFRNGECVTPCKEPEVFASKTSNKCIKCETTNLQGIGTDDDYNPTCIQCDEKTELWMNNRGKCIEKSKMTTYTKQDMKKCWRCDGVDNFQKCLNGEKPYKFCPEDYTGEN